MTKMNDELRRVVSVEFKKFLDRGAQGYARHSGVSLAEAELVGWGDYTDDTPVSNRFWNGIWKKLENVGFEPQEIQEVKDVLDTRHTDPDQNFIFTSEVSYKLLALCWSRNSSKTTEFESIDEIQGIINKMGYDPKAFTLYDLTSIEQAGEELYGYKTDPNRFWGEER